MHEVWSNKQTLGLASLSATATVKTAAKGMIFPGIDMPQYLPCQRCRLPTQQTVPAICQFKGITNALVLCHFGMIVLHTDLIKINLDQSWFLGGELEKKSDFSLKVCALDGKMRLSTVIIQSRSYVCDRPYSKILPKLERDIWHVLEEGLLLADYVQWPGPTL